MIKGSCGPISWCSSSLKRAWRQVCRTTSYSLTSLSWTKRSSHDFPVFCADSFITEPSQECSISELGSSRGCGVFVSRGTRIIRCLESEDLIADTIPGEFNFTCIVWGKGQGIGMNLHTIEVEFEPVVCIDVARDFHMNASNHPKCSRCKYKIFVSFVSHN